MEFVRVAKAAEFTPGVSHSVRVVGRHVRVYMDAEGTLRAMENGCRHQGADLSGGRREGSVVVCPRHGWRYDLATGACVGGDGRPLRAYHCRVEGENVLVSLFPVPEGTVAETGRPGAP